MRTKPPAAPVSAARVGEQVTAPYSRLRPVQEGGGKPDPNPPPPEPNRPPPVYKKPPPPPPPDDGKKPPQPPQPPKPGGGGGGRGEPPPDDGKTPKTHTCGAAGKKPEFIADIVRDLRRRGKAPNPKTEAQKEKIREASKAKLKKLRAGPLSRNNDDASARLVTRVLSPPEIEWEEILRVSLDAATTKLSRRGRPSWTRLSRATYGLWGTVGQVLEPARKGNRKGWDVALIVDTSASVRERSLGVALKEAAMLLVHPNIARVLFIASDWAATACEEIMVAEVHGSPQAAEERLLPLFIGDRGSDVSGAVEEVVRIDEGRQDLGQPPIPVCVVFTDGDISWPDAEAFADMEVVVVLLPGHWTDMDVAVEDTKAALAGVPEHTIIVATEGDATVAYGADDD